ncbi:MAG: hypothetical protein OEV40_30150 [Acidimicrobiia bacterium]|nr:hypothetical protein [Acidimicrobiia bacterium]
MTPTLLGRIQTRIFLLGTVGLMWTILVVPVLPKRGATIGETYAATILALILVAVLGVGWELVYHFFQQYRWEKDWPILLALVVGIPESLLTFLAVDSIILSGPSPVTFFLHFYSTWIIVWLVALGPIRVLLPRWRFNGGRIL